MAYSLIPTMVRIMQLQRLGKNGFNGLALALPLSFFFGLTILGQSIFINADHMPLNKCLEQLRDEFELEFSYSDEDLAEYSITHSGMFSSAEEAVTFLLKNLPFGYDYLNGVFIIYPEDRQPIRKEYFLSGRLLDSARHEPLPFTNIIINNTGFIANENGYFSYTSSVDSIFKFRASHLGYRVLDTMLMACANCNINLSQIPVALATVKVKKYLMETASVTGNNAGHIKLNSAIINHLPGQSDNSLYSVLRLQPGVLASGEQTNDLIVLGCSEGEAQVFFDKIPIWNLKNFHDNIGIINPLVIKNLEIYKAGYDATKNDKIGGIIEIAGKDGVQPGFNSEIMVSNLLANALIEMPVTKRSSLKLAYRRTYYNLFSTTEEDPVPSARRRNNYIDVQIVPDYSFSDVNIKYSGRLSHNDYYYVSALLANDDFSYSIVNTDRLNFTNSGREDNKRKGISGYYERNWSSGSSTLFNAYYSDLNGTSENLRVIISTQGHGQRNRAEVYREYEDKVSERGMEVKQQISVNSMLRLETGIRYILTNTSVRQDSNNIQNYNINSRNIRLAAFAQSNLKINNKLDLLVGARLNYSVLSGKMYMAPRFSLNYYTHKNWRLNASIGEYHQFVTRSVVKDETGNYHYIITCSDGDTIPVLKSYHAVGNVAFTKNATHINFETYYKYTNGTTSFQRSTQDDNVYTGQSKSYGAELLLKQNIRRHVAWISYNLGKVVERYPDYLITDYMRTPYDQRHEVKLAGIFNLKKFYVSGNYIFGSGLPVFTRYADRTIINEDPYHRADVTMALRFKKPVISGELGVSVLNITDYENLRINDSEILPEETLISAVNIYSEPMPRTFTVFLKIKI